MMTQRVGQDWAELHEGLVAKYPGVLGGLTEADYLWALSTIWSRAVGVEKDGRCVCGVEGLWEGVSRGGRDG
jgi:hypothetical protein